MKTETRQIVIMADGDVRIPPSTGPVAHGHRPPDEHIKITVPAGKRWLLVELELELEEAEVPNSIGAMRA
jgi:hypothetical protein